MDGKRAQGFQYPQVLRCWIFLVGRKPVARVLLVHFGHIGGPCGFGNDGGGGYAGGKSISMDEAFLRKGTVLNSAGVHHN